MTTIHRKLCKMGARKCRNRAVERFAKAMEPQLFSLPDKNHKSFGLFLPKMRCKLLIRRSFESTQTLG